MESNGDWDKIEKRILEKKEEVKSEFKEKMDSEMWKNKLKNTVDSVKNISIWQSILVSIMIGHYLFLYYKGEANTFQAILTGIFILIHNIRMLQYSRKAKKFIEKQEEKE